MEKTKYRTISNGHWNFLQYLVVKKFLWFKFDEWNYVPTPYYDIIWGRDLDSTGSDRFINSLHHDIEEFVNKYPYIDEYLKIYESKQAVLEAEVRKERQKYENKKNTVHYF